MGRVRVWWRGLRWRWPWAWATSAATVQPRGATGATLTGAGGSMRAAIRTIRGDAVMIVTDRGEFCYVVAVKGVAVAALARNHRGAAGGDGPGQILRVLDDQSSTEPDVWPTAVVGISVWPRAPPGRAGAFESRPHGERT